MPCLTRADVNAKDNDGWTALILGDEYADIERALLDKGADVNAKDKDGNSVLWFVPTDPLLRALNGKSDKDYDDVIQILKDAGARE